MKVLFLAVFGQSLATMWVARDSSPSDRGPEGEGQDHLYNGDQRWPWLSSAYMSSDPSYSAIYYYYHQGLDGLSSIAGGKLLS